MLKTTLDRFRLIAFLEGISFIGLLFIAMPLKYMAGNPLPVKIVGMTHGILFILFVYLLFEAAGKYKWSAKFNSLAFLASIIPFGTFLLDRKLKTIEVNP